MSLTITVVADDVRPVLRSLLLSLLTLVVVVVAVVGIGVDLRGGLFLPCLSLLLLLLLWWCGVFEFSHLVCVHHLDLSSYFFLHDPLFDKLLGLGMICCVEY